MKNQRFFAALAALAAAWGMGGCQRGIPATPMTIPTATPLPRATATPLPASDDIAFAAPDAAYPGSMRLYKIHPDGTGLTALTDPGLKVFHPSWSPDKGWVVFEGYGTSPARLYTVDADGTGLAVVPNTAQAGAPAWSPDGTRIAFVSYAAGSAQLWSIHPDGTALTQLTAESGGVSPEDFAWSPDSREIAYSTLTKTRLMDADGGNVRDFPVLMKQMDWSPDGQSFVFDAYVDTVNNLNVWQVFRVNADGTGLAQLTDTDSHGGACWSRDGGRIVLVDLLAQGPPNMILLNPDGSGAAPLPNASIYYCYQPCWH